MMRALHAEYHIPLDLLVQDYALAQDDAEVNAGSV